MILLYIMKSLIDILPEEIIQLIYEHKAAIKIQETAYKKFYRKYGPTWKRDICIIWRAVYQYDYFAYLNNISDPWHDYIGDEQFQYF